MVSKKMTVASFMQAGGVQCFACNQTTANMARANGLRKVLVEKTDHSVPPEIKKMLKTAGTTRAKSQKEM